MKRFLAKFNVVVLLMAIALGTIACSGQEKKVVLSKDKKNLIIGASSDYSGPLVESAKAELESKGYNVEIVIYDDFVMPNKALEEGAIDANFFQHKPYLDMYNESNNSDLVMIEPKVMYYPYELFSKKIKTYNDIPEGATVAVVDDPSNIEQSLIILQKFGAIELADKAVDKYYSIADIRKNDKNIKLQPVDYFSLHSLFDDVDMVIGDGYIGCLHPKVTEICKNPLEVLEDTTYALGLTVKSEDVDKQWVKDINEALRSKTTKDNLLKKLPILPSWIE